ncbi:tryptophan halogenase family protein [Nitrospirillum iridis]|uniref:Glycine/D-amino acid oxidase-like deaminating enzyme n=1 Tax=Nitrospirillum iridis TaxID=765888 RepID=A0A7X0B3F5_9PROT|nr:tryptophan halogenase family protein [Nitrospirillum iridis]MBB6254657.1 glycine/D-amino acid oxidase-like deaminating enzyme [Nitrospirillum iridis]
MTCKRTILILGGGTAGWLAAAYLAKYLGVSKDGPIGITLLESPDIGIIGVGEGTFPTIRTTLKFLGLNEAEFMRETAATFKQGIRFTDWVTGATADGGHDSFFHPFEAPFPAEGTGLVPYWLLQDKDRRLPFAQAMTFQQQVADALRAPKRGHEGDFEAPLNYAYHFDAAKGARVLARRAVELGVRHLSGTVMGVALAEDGAIAQVTTREQGALAADFYVDCSGFRAELIGRALGVPQKSVRPILFADRALTCKMPYDAPDAPLESCTVATAHAGGWTWDIGLTSARGVGCVYSSDHISDAQAEETVRAYLGPGVEPPALRKIAFDSGYRETPWVKNCVAIGLAGGFLEPLESTSVVLIEVAVGMLAELFPHDGRWDAPAARFNELMTRRFENIVNFLKLHYCLSRREEPFWRDNRTPESIPAPLRDLLEQWRVRPPSRFDFALDLEAFAFFNYQYILYGMGFDTDLSAARGAYPHGDTARKMFARIQSYGDHATRDLPAHRALIRQINKPGVADAPPLGAPPLDKVGA